MKQKPATIFLFLNDSGGLALGDALVHLPVLRALKEWSPETQITVMPAAGGVTALMPLFAPYLHAAVDQLPLPSQPKFDWAFDLVGESAAMTFKIRRLARQRFYSTARRGWLHLPRLPIYHGKHVARRHFGLLRQAIGEAVASPWPWPIPPVYQAAAAALLPLGPTYIGIAPGAGNIGREKRWPLESYVALARHQAELSRTPVIFLGPNEAGWETHFAAIPGVRFPLAENTAQPSGVPTDPTLTIALAGLLAAAVTNCCGAGHMFALGGAPLVSLFGPTNFKKSAPYVQNGLCVLPAPLNSRDIRDVKIEAALAAIDSLILPNTTATSAFHRICFPEIHMNASSS
jgi:ADP-heptose:LPS heptosyltransferase